MKILDDTHIRWADSSFGPVMVGAPYGADGALEDPEDTKRSTKFNDNREICFICDTII